MDLQRMQPDLGAATQIAAQGFVQPVSDELLMDVDTHLRNGEMVYSMMEGGVLVGFSVFQLLGSVLYLSGIILLPGVQGKGFAGEVVAQVTKDTGARFLALRTQSTHMWRAGEKSCSSWVPHPNCGISDELQQIGEGVAPLIGSTFPVTVAQYGRALYGAKPVHRDVTLQKWWDSICDFERGDAVLCVGELQ